MPSLADRRKELVVRRSASDKSIERLRGSPVQSTSKARLTSTKKSSPFPPRPVRKVPPKHPPITERHSHYEERQDHLRDNYLVVKDWTHSVSSLDEHSVSGGANRSMLDEIIYDPIAAMELKDLHHENDRLKEECKGLAQLRGKLQAALQSTRKEMDLMKMRTTVQIGNLELEVINLKEDRKCLMEKCASLGEAVQSLRLENAMQESRIWTLESDCQAKKKLAEAVRHALGLEKKVERQQRQVHSDSSLYTKGLKI
jgi:chromosome segregation ATPase